MLEEKVNLQLWVKVKKDWRDSDFMIKNFGYDKKISEIRNDDSVQTSAFADGTVRI